MRHQPLMGWMKCSRLSSRHLFLKTNSSAEFPFLILIPIDGNFSNGNYFYETKLAFAALLKQSSA